MIDEWVARASPARARAAASAVCCAAVIAVATAARPAAAGATTTRGRIVALAEQQLGYRDHGSYCTKFGPCELWCSLFVTWVWQRAGVPVPSLAFTGYLYDWAQATTAIEGRGAVPSPGDAVLFGTGPASVSTSVHAGIVEAAYPGYLVTIEGDVLHGVRRFVVPVRRPQLVGEPGPIYAYAAPLATGLSAQIAPALTFRRPAPAMIARQRARRHRSLERLRLRRAIAALRAFQHMPYQTAQLTVDWTGVDSQGLVDVRVMSPMPMSWAVAQWQAFLRRFDDAGHAYNVTFQAPPDPAATTPSPSPSAGPPAPPGPPGAQ